MKAREKAQRSDYEVCIGIKKAGCNTMSPAGGCIWHATRARADRRKAHEDCGHTSQDRTSSAQKSALGGVPANARWALLHEKCVHLHRHGE